MSVNHLHIHKIDGGDGFHVRCACGVEATLYPTIIERECVTAQKQLTEFEREHFGFRHLAKSKPGPETLDLSPAASPAGGA